MNKPLLIAIAAIVAMAFMVVLPLMVVLIPTTADADCRQPTFSTTASANTNTTNAADAAALDVSKKPRTAPSPSESDVREQLMGLRFDPGHSTMTREQADNAIIIAQVAKKVEVPRLGLIYAIAAAIQESKLVNIDGGNADSAGLFQQRPSAGWGTHNQITTPRLAAEAFFGRAKHTDNTGLLDIDGWEDMSLNEAVSAVQRPAESLRDAYAHWQPAAEDIADVLGGDLPDVTTIGQDCDPEPAPCAADADYDLGPVEPQLRRLVAILAPMFNIEVVGGYRASATDPEGHPAGLAADFMVPLNADGRLRGNRLAAYARQHAGALGVDYIIWRQRIWSLARANQGWRRMEDRGGATENHYDHVHINVRADASGTPPVGSSCDEVVYPIGDDYISGDAHNWHEGGSHWDSWHTGTDFGAPCGAPVYAAHAGTIEIDTAQSWAGPWLVKVTTGASSLTTWYAHMSDVTVSRGETVQPGQQIGEVGDEGNSSGCHLHFEVHLENGSIYGPDNVDPSQWLADNARRRTSNARTRRTRTGLT